MYCWQAEAREAEEKAATRSDEEDMNEEHADEEADNLNARRVESPVSPPVDDSDDDGAGGDNFVFTGAVRDDSIPSSQYGEQKFEEGADVVMTKDNNIHVSASLRDDATFAATATAGVHAQESGEAVTTSPVDVNQSAGADIVVEGTTVANPVDDVILRTADADPPDVNRVVSSSSRATGNDAETVVQSEQGGKDECVADTTAADADPLLGDKSSMSQYIGKDA